MRKKQSLLWISILGLLLSGCAKKSDNTIADVEGIPTVQERESVDSPEAITIQEDTDGLNGISSFMVRFYISDDHFYEENEIDFMTFEDGHFLNYHIKVLDAYILDEESDSMKYVLENSSASKTFEEEKENHPADELVWLCVPVEITNPGEDVQRICIGNFHMYKRVEDNSLTEYNLPDKRITSIGISGELWYDYPDKVNNTNKYYFVDIQPNQTISTNIFYLCLKEDLKEDIYMNLFWTNGTYDNKLECNMPPEDENVKCIRVNIKEGD